MTHEEAMVLLDDLVGPERIEAAELILMLRGWEAAGVSVSGVVKTLKGLRPIEVLEVVQYARRKVDRTRRR